MKALIAVSGYPTPSGSKLQYFVHSRNKYYVRNGISVVVLNFATKVNYIIDDIEVISLSEFQRRKEAYDILICHAANLRNHYIFLKRYGNIFPKKIFIFHGHEVLHINKYYPKPYQYIGADSKTKAFLQDRYDDFKIFIWKKYYKKNIKQLRLLFVSEWIYQKFLIEMKYTNNLISESAEIISNSIGEFFELNTYEPEHIQYDFITIRNVMDDSKYGIDIVVRLAEKNPDLNFCIIGHGDFFNHIKKPENVTWIDRVLDHEKMQGYLNKARYGLFPTREDTQGLMACEIAAYGLPLITSDIDVCRLVFSDCPRIAFINNDTPDLLGAMNKLDKQSIHDVWERYYAKNTIYKEIEYIKNYVKNR